MRIPTREEFYTLIRYQRDIEELENKIERVKEEIKYLDSLAQNYRLIEVTTIRYIDYTRYTYVKNTIRDQFLSADFDLSRLPDLTEGDFQFKDKNIVLSKTNRYMVSYKYNHDYGRNESPYGEDNFYGSENRPNNDPSWYLPITGLDKAKGILNDLKADAERKYSSAVQEQERYISIKGINPGEIDFDATRVKYLGDLYIDYLLSNRMIPVPTADIRVDNIAYLLALFVETDDRSGLSFNKELTDKDGVLIKNKIKTRKQTEINLTENTGINTVTQNQAAFRKFILKDGNGDISIRTFHVLMYAMVAVMSVARIRYLKGVRTASYIQTYTTDLAWSDRPKDSSVTTRAVISKDLVETGAFNLHPSTEYLSVIKELINDIKESILMSYNKFADVTGKEGIAAPFLDVEPKVLTDEERQVLSYLLDNADYHKVIISKNEDFELSVGDKTVTTYAEFLGVLVNQEQLERYQRVMKDSFTVVRELGDATTNTPERTYITVSDINYIVYDIPEWYEGGEPRRVSGTEYGNKAKFLEHFEADVITPRDISVTYRDNPEKRKAIMDNVPEAMISKVFYGTIKLINAIRATPEYTKEYTMSVCHSSCHSNCHGSRGRR